MEIIHCNNHEKFMAAPLGGSTFVLSPTTALWMDAYILIDDKTFLIVCAKYPIIRRYDESPLGALARVCEGLKNRNLYPLSFQQRFWDGNVIMVRGATFDQIKTCIKEAMPVTIFCDGWVKWK